jgi:uncharacterized protein (DUF1800 family)
LNFFAGFCVRGADVKKGSPFWELMKMKTDRTLVLMVCGLFLCVQPAQCQLPDSDEKVLHLLNRISFGPTPDSVEAVKKQGIEAYISAQLHPEQLPESQDVDAFIESCPALSLTPGQLFEKYGPPAVKAQQRELADEQGLRPNAVDKNAVNKIRQQMFKSVYDEAARAKVLRALSSPRQLQEVMTDFWFNHFNIFSKKGLDNLWVGAFEERAIRPYALGRFRDLLGATCHHGAMLFYLDNWRNKALPADGKAKVDGSNENYARELMELHTLGVDGGYTQTDVTELARVLTGLGLPRPAAKNGGERADNSTFGCYFDSRRHDFGDKKVLGHVIRGSGPAEIEQALDILAKSPATAHHISYQLAQYFVADTPPETLVNKLAVTFTKTDGDIRAVMNDLLHSPEFWNKEYEGAKFKNPFRYVLSTLRALDANPSNYEPLFGFLRQQGMPVYGCLTPDGYKNTTSAWLNQDTLLRRINFATGLVMQRMPQVYSGNTDSKALLSTVGGDFSNKTRSVIDSAPPAIKAALILGSPEFMQY